MKDAQGLEAICYGLSVEWDTADFGLHRKSMKCNQLICKLQRLAVCLTWKRLLSLKQLIALPVMLQDKNCGNNCVHLSFGVNLLLVSS